LTSKNNQDVEFNVALRQFTVQQSREMIEVYIKKELKISVHVT